MNKIQLIFLLMLMSISAFSQKDIGITLKSRDHQRTCATHDLHVEKLKKDANYRRQFKLSQERITELIKSGKSLRVAEDGVITIPVVYHVLHNGESIGSGSNISDELLLAQLEQLNQDYRATNSDVGDVPEEFSTLVADMKIEFCLATRTPSNTATTGIERYNYNQSSYSRDDLEATIKPETIWDRDSYLNIWVAQLGSGLLGYAQFPGGTANTDGVVVTVSSVGSLASPNPNGGSYGSGRTLTHEAGHWLHLYHIWGDDSGACTGSDEVDDTPNQADSYGGSPTYPQASCDSNDMFMNYMDYVQDNAMHMFSKGQKLRSDAALAGDRVPLLSSQGCVPLEGLIIGTDENTKETCEGETITFDVNVNYYGDYTGDVTVSQSGLPENNVTLSQTEYTQTGTLTITVDATGFTQSSYPFTITATDGTTTQTLDLTLNIVPELVEGTTLIAPANSDSLDQFALFSWEALASVDQYTFEIATDSNFNNIVYTTSTPETSSYALAILDTNTDYYWRVKANNLCGTSISDVRSFTISTNMENCSNFITDGGFEETNTWGEFSSNEQTLITNTTPQNGSNSAVLGVVDSENSFVYQTVVIPANASIAKLKYSYSIISEDICGYDRGGVAVFFPDGEFEIIKEYDFCSAGATNGFVDDCVDLSKYKGQVIEIDFFVLNDYITPGTLVIDDVKLSICNEAPLRIPSDNKEYIADYEITEDGWTHYIDDNGTPCDYIDDWRLLSVEKGGTDLGSVGDNGFRVSLFSNPTSSNINNTEITENNVFFNRHWELVPTAQPNTQIPVRYYFTNEDIQGFESVIGSEINPSNLYAWKINDAPTLWDYNPENGFTDLTKASTYDADGFWEYTPGTASTSSTSYSEFNEDHYLEYVVGHFGGGGGAGSERTLPVDLEQFTVAVVNNDAILKWSTLSEINNSHFEIERSFNGIDFETIATVKGNGTTTARNEYNFTDINVSSSVAYYRLKQVDFDGKSAHSNTESVRFDGLGFTNIFPNPTQANTSITIENTINIDTISIYNSLGVLVVTNTYNGVNTTTVDLSNLDAGIYLLVINNNDTHKLIIK